jgi:hypothetical protein
MRSRVGVLRLLFEHETAKVMILPFLPFDGYGP